jgi:hypothetical protein
MLEKCKMALLTNGIASKSPYFNQTWMNENLAYLPSVNLPSWMTLAM